MSVNLRQTLAKQLKAGFMLTDITKGFQKVIFKLVLRNDKKPAWRKLSKHIHGKGTVSACYFCMTVWEMTLERIVTGHKSAF